MSGEQVTPENWRLGDEVPPGWKIVDCPNCGNRNRKARRECKRASGMCKGTGKVLKTFPADTRTIQIVRT